MADPIAIAVVGHTNAGKTSLLRTLTRRSGFGEVSDRPGTTRHVESIDLRIDGTRDERDAVLHRLAERRPGRLLLVCHAGSTPDRGTQRFLAAARVPSTAVLLAPATGRAVLEQARWRAWLDDSGLADVPVLADEPVALAWLEHGDG